MKRPVTTWATAALRDVCAAVGGFLDAIVARYVDLGSWDD